MFNYIVSINLIFYASTFSFIFKQIQKNTKYFIKIKIKK